MAKQIWPSGMRSYVCRRHFLLPLLLCLFFFCLLHSLTHGLLKMEPRCVAFLAKVYTPKMLFSDKYLQYALYTMLVACLRRGVCVCVCVWVCTAAAGTDTQPCEGKKL
ncbi:hypothetical protein LZ32DRAFT_402257 [Colletotrichum eremochloae]|nr:hypothetical protein LZ32DRAFT_402257 [Colletotrichum eremochloae]